MQDERRRTPRYPFSGSVELIRIGEKAGISAKVTELSLYGCYVEMPDPFQKGTQIMLKIYSNGKFLETQGIVVYSHETQGIGVNFQNVNPHYLTVLKQWLIEAAHLKFGKKD
ncbi:MAG TPA: PilZ domain-containing protein [Candidatus Solibacter sp.]|nr:PilZ domain-containing protein [Candidatus Solibacter sp.]